MVATDISRATLPPAKCVAAHAGIVDQALDRPCGFSAPPEACLINFYAGGAKLGSHADTDEQEFSAPVISVSLGDAAAFHVGGLRRSDPKTSMRLESGDVVVLGGAARRAFHGIDRIYPGTSDLLPKGGRINLTMRRVTRG